MSGWAAAAGAAGDIISGVIQGRYQSGGAKQDRAFNLDMYLRQLEDQKQWQGEQYGRIVKGAEAAGLHPLFALGTGQSSSPSAVLPGKLSPGGASGLAAGLSRASAHVQRYLESLPGEKRAQEAHELDMERKRIDIENARRDQVLAWADDARAHRIFQNMQRNPDYVFPDISQKERDVRAEAYRRQVEFESALRVTTVPGQKFVDALGNTWLVRKGWTPVGPLEELLGEAAELFGKIAIGAHGGESVIEQFKRRMRRLGLEMIEEGSAMSDLTGGS